MESLTQPVTSLQGCIGRPDQIRKLKSCLHLTSIRLPHPNGLHLKLTVTPKNPYRRRTAPCTAQTTDTSPRMAAATTAAGKENSAVSSAVIVGGGIGGLILAIALRKIGIDAQVYDKEEARDVTRGTLISLAPNGLKALAAIDNRIPDTIIKNGAPLKETKVRNREGVILTSTIPDSARDGYPTVCIRWSKILDTFREFLPPSCQHSGYTFTGQISQEGDEVAVVFEKDGREVTLKTPLLIGSDGVHSQVRTHVLGRKVPPRDMKRIAWRAVVPKSFFSHKFMEEGVATVAFSNGRTFFSADPGHDSTYICVTCTDEASGGATRHQSTTADEAKRRLVEQIKGWKEYLPIINALDAESIVERRILDLPPLDTWRRGRVVIIGDAAHAMPPAIGQGANTAIEDSLELARQLAKAESAEEALEEFVKLQIPRLESIVEKNKTMLSIAYRKPGANPVDGSGKTPLVTNKLDSNGPITSMTDILVNVMYDYERLREPLV